MPQDQHIYVPFYRQKCQGSCGWVWCLGFHVHRERNEGLRVCVDTSRKVASMKAVSQTIPPVLFCIFLACLMSTIAPLLHLYWTRSEFAISKKTLAASPSTRALGLNITIRRKCLPDDEPLVRFVLSAEAVSFVNGSLFRTLLQSFSRTGLINLIKKKILSLLGKIDLARRCSADLESGSCP